jgi:TolB-like protein/DNA-binding winged helix-turn-helix (wHTH) protein/Tfp pilus assembly protein PilF
VRLAPHTVDVLVYLAERPNKLVSKEEMLESLWPGIITGDSAVHNAISSLRQAFHDDTKHPAYIATVPKKGYRLIAIVQQLPLNHRKNLQTESVAALPKPDKGKRSYVFICYSHKDSNLVFPEIHWLQDQGVDIWYDEGISAGKNWRAEIGDSLLGASHVLYYISQAALDSDHCNREINLALDEGKEILPIYLEEIELTSDLKVGLSRVQALFTKDTSYQHQLLDALGAHSIGATTTSPKAPQGNGNWPLLTGVAVAVLVFGLIAWYGFKSFDRVAADNQIRSIAVLPLQIQSRDSTQEYFADGTTDLLIQDFDKIRSLRVVPLQSIIRYRKTEKSLPEIVEELDVDGLLTGTVMLTQARVRISVQLYDAKLDRNIWTAQYERDLTDILALQAEIARSVSTQVSIKLTGDELTSLSTTRKVNPASHNAFLLGHFQITRGNIGLAIPQLKKAIELDPLNVGALVELSRAMLIQATVKNENVLPEEARAYLERALVLNPDHPEARAFHGTILFFLDRKYQQSIDSFAELLNTHPNNTYCLYQYTFELETIGRLDLALQLTNRQIKLSPLDATAYTNQGRLYKRLGRYAEAVASHEQAEKLGKPSPTNLASVAFEQGNREALMTQLGRDIKDWSINRNWRSLMQATLASLEGDLQRMRDIVRPLDKEEGVTSWLIQRYYPLMLGDTERALEYHSRALTNKEFFALNGALGEVGEHLRHPEYYNHPKYKEMLREIGLDPASIAELKVPPFPF